MEKLSEQHEYDGEDEDIFDLMKQVDETCSTEQLKIQHNVLQPIHEVEDNGYQMDL